ncbi:class E sortase [uncultured Friedmanniella sp.]|uniref:class E sortase n=1 Tax=uncultured Friedmanniella sp. TaxID=335381 RepID=UPI0035C9C54B
MSPSPTGARRRLDASDRPRSRRRPSTLLVVGLVLLTAGLGCLGWVVYQYVGTNVVAERSFDTQRQDLKSRWTEPSVSPSARPSARSAAPRTADPGHAAALLRIPRFGADYEVPIIEGTTLDDLAKGVGHYSGTAGPGGLGNFALAGHRVTHGQPFAHLLELDQGDQVIVETAAATYTYVLDTAPRDLTVTDTAGWVLDPVPGEPDATPGRSLLTLTTCQDLFHSPDRSVAFGHLASTQNK